MPKAIRLQTSPSSNGYEAHILANGMPATRQQGLVKTGNFGRCFHADHITFSAG
jgi:hypothetical protein